MDKKYAIQGIIGCLLFGIGDWLLGFVDPGKVEARCFILYLRVMEQLMQIGK